MMYWQKEIETMDRKDLVKFQLERLKQTIELAGNSPFYHKIFKEKGITPDSFQSLEDLQNFRLQRKMILEITIRSDWQPSRYRNAYVSTLPVERQVILPLSYIPPRIWTNGLTK